MKKIFTLAVLLLWCLTAVTGYAQEKPAAKPEAKAASGDAKARAKQILDAARQAKGSPEKLKAARDLMQRSDASANIMGQSFDLSVTGYLLAPDKSRAEINIPAMGTIVQVLSGSAGWMDIPGQGAMDMPDQMLSVFKQNLAREWFVSFLVAADGKEAEATALEDAEVNGKPADAVAVTIGDAKFNIYFDKQTHLALKTAYETLNQQMEMVKAESIYDDYKDVGGIKLAHKTTVFQAGEKFLEAKVSEIKINSGVEAAKFTKQ